MSFLSQDSYPRKVLVYNNLKLPTIQLTLNLSLMAYLTVYGLRVYPPIEVNRNFSFSFNQLIDCHPVMQ